MSIGVSVRTTKFTIRNQEGRVRLVSSPQTATNLSANVGEDLANADLQL